MGLLAVKFLTQRSFHSRGLPVVDLWPGSPAFRALLILAGRRPGLAALASSRPSPGSESPFSFPVQVALNLFLLTQELYL